jgi:pyruvate carboxylase subunit B
MIPVELVKLSEEANKLGIIKKEEDLITYAMYPQVATKFLRGELKEEALLTAPVPSKAPASVSVTPMEFAIDVDGEVFNVKVSPVGGKLTSDVEKTKPKEIPKGAVVSPMQGMVLTVKVKPGDKVTEGDVVLIIEAMKMRNDVRSPVSGIVKQVMTHDGEVVSGGDVLIVIESK